MGRYVCQPVNQSIILTYNLIWAPVENKPASNPKAQIKKLLYLNIVGQQLLLFHNIFEIIVSKLFPQD